MSVLICFFVFCGKAAAQLSATATLNTNDVLIGDEVEMTIFISYTKAVKMTGLQLDVLSPIDSLELKSTPKADTATTDPYNVTQKLVFTAFDAGTYQIPPIPINYTENGLAKQESTPPLQFVVRTIPVQLTDSTDLQPIKDIIEEPVSLEEVLPLLALILAPLVLLTIVYFLLSNKKKKEKEKIEVAAPPPPAHVLAFEQLQQLKEEDLLPKGEFKKYQSRLTFILRAYLENRYQINALESTTPEIIQDLKEKDFPEQWQTDLKAMLEKADLVKFAKAAFPNTFHEEAYDMVYRFVESTRQIEIEDTEEETSEDEANSEHQDNKVTNE